MTTMYTKRPAAAGLCGTTPVLTPRGWRALAELEPGDLVVDRDGVARPVVRRAALEVAPVLQVSVVDGTVLHAAPGQPWLVEIGTGLQRQAEMVTTLELADLTRRRSGVRLVRARAAVLGELASDLPLPPYVLGCLLANGAISSGCSVRLWTTEPVIRAHVERDLPAGARFGPIPSIVGTAIGWSIIGRQRGPGGNPVLNALRDLGLTGCRSFQKYVPEAYKYAGVEQRHALLQGLLDCDGAADPAPGRSPSPPRPPSSRRTSRSSSGRSVAAAASAVGRASRTPRPPSASRRLRVTASRWAAYGCSATRRSGCRARPSGSGRR